jgi:dienelactone hydrolase
MHSLRERLAEFIGFLPAEYAPTIESVGRELCDGYARRVVRYAVPDQEQVEASLFEPIGRPPHGGILALHQHNSQWTIGKSEVAGLVGDPMQAFGPVLARRGVTVLAPDAVGFETRLSMAAGPASLAPSVMKSGSSADDWLQYYNQMAHRLVRGDLLMRKMLQDAQTAFSVLRREVSGDVPVGVIGDSMGGSVALFLGGLDTRIDMTCSSGAVASYRERLARGLALEMAQIIPGFAKWFDVDDVMRCIAPRRLLVVSADDDFGSVDAAELVQQVRPAFDVREGGARLAHVHVAGGHALDQQRFDAIVEWVFIQCQTG